MILREDFLLLFGVVGVMTPENLPVEPNFKGRYEPEVSLNSGE